MELYGENEFAKAKQSTLIRAGIAAGILIIMIVFLALFVTVWRNPYMPMVVCAIGGVAFYFYLTMKFLPWLRYWLYLADVKKGRAHEWDCSFVSVSDSERICDGVAFHEFVVELDDSQSKDNERLFFWDADKVLPELKKDEKIHIRSFGNYIIALEKI